MSGRPSMPTAEQLLALCAHLNHDLRLLVDNFETEPAMHEERRTRLDDLIRSSEPGADDLAGELDYGEDQPPAASLADPVFMMLVRLVLANYLINSMLRARRDGLRVRFFTIVIPQHVYSAAMLAGVRPRKLTKWLWRLIRDHLPADAKGWVYAQIHAEYEPTTGKFVLHFHGVAAGDYVAVLNGPVRAALRRLLPSKPARSPSRPELHVRVPLQMKKPGDYPRQVAYVLQSWWPSRPLLLTPKGWTRTRPKRRIPEPFHSQYLLWLHRWTVSDMRLRMGMGNGG